MTCLVLLGSRNHDGQTARAAGAFARGAEAAGAVVETIYLTECRLERCRQCDARGWGICRSDGVCVIDDDLAGLVEKIIAADVLVLATPVYYGDLSESMHAMLMRLRRTTTFPDRRTQLEGKPVVGICVAGGSGGGADTCCAQLTKIILTSGMRVADMLPVKRQNLALKEVYLEHLGKKAEWDGLAH